MLNGAIGDFLPVALAVALSPIPIIAVVLVLGTPRARSNGPLFAVGWVVGLAAVAALVVALLDGLQVAEDADGGPSTLVSLVRIAFGLLLLVLAVQQWGKRPNDGAEPEMPGWMAGIDAFTPWKSFLFGLALSAANPKNLILTLAAAASIAQSGLDGPGTVIAVAVFVLIGSTTVAGAVLYALLAGSRAAGPLDSLKAFMVRNNAVIMTIVLLILGAKVLGDGIGGLRG